MKRIVRKRIAWFCFLFLGILPLAYGQRGAVYSQAVDRALQQALQEDNTILSEYYLLAYKKDGIFARLEISNATLLHVAAADNAVPLVEALLEAGLGPDSETSDLQTPLHWAARKGAADTLEVLLEAKANPNYPDNNRRTPLWMAAFHGQTVAALLLLRYGADPDLKGLDPKSLKAYTPYRAALANRHRGTAALIESMGGR